MTLLIFFAVLFATIVLAILVNRIVRCPILVGFAFFSVALLIAVILSNTTLIILAIVLGIIAFLAAFLDCVLMNSNCFRNNSCLNCHNPYENNSCNNNNNDDDTLTIVNSNGEIVARINGNSVSCNNNNGCGCGCNSGCNSGCGNSSATNALVANLLNENNINTTSINGTASSSGCGCCNNRSYRYR